MEAKTFSVNREGKTGFRATGFPDKNTPFVSLVIGDDAHGGEFSVILYMDAARALADALDNAINHAKPRAVEAADIGIAA